MEEKPFDIPASGSLGLLALGYRGLLAWREKRAAYEAENGPIPGFYLVKKNPETETKTDIPRETDR